MAAMFSHEFSLHDHTAIVTGAARGIGYSIADILSGLGANVLLQDIDGDNLEKAFLNFNGNERKVCHCQGDVSQEADIERMVSEALRRWGRIDILVNNAGIGGVGKKIIDLTVDEWQRMIDVDLTSVFLCCRAVLPHMIEQKRGAIVNIASITGQMGVAGSTHYAAAKAGVIGFTKSLAREVAEHRVNVNVIAPGLIDTDMSRARGIEHQQHLVIWPRIGTVEDIGWAVAYLASDHAEFITGTVLNINGGAYM
jgi:NAD(P)-dependent dehydrogenase (short-subunit alcohol dehydrogenase family)